MKISDISVPQVYREESADFRFFLRWFEHCLTKVHYDTENAPDLYDPLRCPHWLLWMLADTMGFKYDDRLPVAFNRFVLVYFMSMIRNRGSKDGVTLAAEANLKQFDIETVAGTGYENRDGEYVEPKDILFNRLEDTSIPVNSAYVTPHTAEGYIDIVYFSDRIPVDACIEYVRPLGMYCLQHAGVRMDGRTKISIDARLTDENNIGMSIGPTHVGHYSREDYASLQDVDRSDFVPTEGDPHHVKEDVIGTRRTEDGREPEGKLSHTRRNVWYRNADAEGYAPTDKIQSDRTDINPGYRSLYSLQLCNNDHIVQSLIPKNPDDPSEGLKEREKIFGLGWGPQKVGVHYPDYLTDEEVRETWLNPDYGPPNADTSYKNYNWNLRYDKDLEEEVSMDVYTIDTEENSGQDRSKDIINPRPAVNPIMMSVGDAISLNEANDEYIVHTEDGTYHPQDHPEDDPVVKDDPGEVEELEVHKVIPDGKIDEKVDSE